MCFLRIKRIPILGNQRKLLLLRGFVGLTAMLLFFLSLKELPFGSAVSLRYLSPIFAAFLAMLFLKDKIKPIQWFYFLMAFAGVFILKGFDTQIGILGLTYSLFGAFFSGCVYVLVRRIGTRDHPLVIINYFMFIAMCCSGLLAIPSWKMPIGTDWYILGGLGIIGFFGQYYMTKGLQTAPVSKVAPIKYIETVFALLVSVSFFGDTYTLASLLGIGLILGGMFLNLGVRKTTQ